MGIGSYKWGKKRFDTLVNNGDPKKRLDIAILGDGYSAEDMPLFEQDVDRFIESFFSFEPMKTYRQHFNIHRVNVISNQSGIYDRYSKEKRKIKSALGAHFSFISPRRLVGWDWRVHQVARRAGVPYDHALVIVNTPRRGGATRFSMDIGYASRNSSDFPRIMVHEAGHSIAKLMDEYVEDGIPELGFLKGRSLPSILPFANVDTNGKTPKWQVWIEPDVELPTPVTANVPLMQVGAYEGASYTKHGAFRPVPNCMMRRHDYDFCPVCQEQWVKRIYAKTSIAESFTPSYSPLTTYVGQTIQFEAQLIRAEAGSRIHTMWQVKQGDGDWFTRQSTDGYKPFSVTFPAEGKWSVQCILADHGPHLRRKEAIRASRQVQTWQLKVG